MREIEVSKITDVVEKLCIDANNHLPCDVKCAIENCRACEDGEIARDEVFPEGSKESYDLYFSLWGGEDEYKYNAKKGTYEYIEEQEEM